MAVSDSFFAFVREHCGSPDGGTAGSYRIALNKLTTIFTELKPKWAPVANVWTMTDPAEIMDVYEKIKIEQGKFRRGGGLFSPYEGKGDSYYKKGWCSAALKFFAQYRAAESYEKGLADAISGTVQTNPRIAAKNAAQVKLPNQIVFVPEGVVPSSKIGKEIVRQVRVRCNQHVFRDAILNNYQSKCCVCGLDVESVLDAAHIKDWSEDLSNALDVTNGLCLSATYHRAFDAHLIEFGDSYEVLLSDALKNICSRSTYLRHFAAYKGHVIALPQNPKCHPDRMYLAAHRSLMVK